VHATESRHDVAASIACVIAQVEDVVKEERRQRGLTWEPQQMDCREPAVAWSSPRERSTTTPLMTTSENAIASSPAVISSSAGPAAAGSNPSSPNARAPAEEGTACETGA